jgi:hypothetical protein
MNLAKYANEGVLYPPLLDGQHYGGTHWTPLPILLNAGAARLTGEYLTSGKLVGIALSVEQVIFAIPLAVWLTAPKESRR